MKTSALNPSKAANIAIYHMQLPTQRAVRFVSVQTKCDRITASKAVTSALIGYQTA